MLRVRCAINMPGPLSYRNSNKIRTIEGRLRPHGTVKGSICVTVLPLSVTPDVLAGASQALQSLGAGGITGACLDGRKDADEKARWTGVPSEEEASWGAC